MKQFFDLYIGGLNTKLGVALGNGTAIQVKHYGHSEPVTVQQRENGIVMECNHAGAYPEQFTEYTGYGEFTQEHTVNGYACDKCELNNTTGEWL